MQLQSIQPLFLILFIAAISCSTPEREKSIAASEEQPAGSAFENATQYNIDTTMSVVTWIGSKPSGKHNGTINFSAGRIGLMDHEVVGGEFTIDIPSLTIMDLKSTDEKYQKLKNHLMSDDFFSAIDFPQAYFEITAVQDFDSTMLKEGKTEFPSDYSPAALKAFIVKKPTHLLTGNLTMRGITKSISFPARIEVSDTYIKAEAKFNIDRTDWDLSYSNEANIVDKAKDQFIYNTVNVGLNVEASRI